MTAPMPDLNRLKSRLGAGQVSTSMVVRYSRGVEVVNVAKAAGFDAVCVDLEHAPLTIDQTGQICVTAQARGVTPLVRVPAGRLDLIGRTLDAGAQGVIIPRVTSTTEAWDAVCAARFPPAGSRSAAGPAIQLDYRELPAATANIVLNDATLVVLMIEAVESVDIIDDLAAVEGVDMLLVGTNNLLGEMGLPGQYEHSSLEAACAEVLAAARRHGKHVGVGGLATRLDIARHYVDLGARYVSLGTDVSFLVRGASAAVGQLHLATAGAR